jgi:hypothetical protein
MSSSSIYSHEFTAIDAAGFALRVDGVTIALCADTDRIWLDREGEGGEFSRREFLETLHRFISERL